MSRLQTAAAQDHGPEVRRWLPPDVGEPEVPPEPPEPEVEPPTEEEIAAIKEAARLAGAEAGFREGYQAGYQEGREKADAEAAAESQEREAREQGLREQTEQTLRETVAALEGIAHDLADPLASLGDDLEPELLTLTVTLAERVIMDELDRRPDLLLGVLQRALDQLPSRHHKIRIHVHPDEQRILETYAQGMDESITWVADQEMRRGGCIVESGPSRIDARFETRLRQAVEAIWGELTPPAPAQDDPAPEVEGGDPIDAGDSMGGGTDESPFDGQSPGSIADLGEPDVSEPEPEPVPEPVPEPEPATDPQISEPETDQAETNP
ncbi:FliH/SctL family protein [Imhoffiella purpurea]|uniref:Flagellar assembly protein FliH n=1 Tax=Imhoffiella purpurea TaxID=1249627 RepID=W9VIP4_9GAMM|nr:FliH/SctL family protein [Imhoffiella purpurea]EXJ16871.1 Flagellar assembly protein FliH [Imhoffiella purpurea]